MSSRVRLEDVRVGEAIPGASKVVQREDVKAYAEAGCTGMEVWLTKLEKHLETHSVADTRQLLQDRQMTLAAACGWSLARR